MSRAGQVFSIFVVGLLSIGTARYTLQPAFQQEELRKKLAKEEQAAREIEAALELQRFETEKAAALQAVPVTTPSGKSSLVQWLKVWDWGKVSNDPASDPSIPKLETASEIPVLAIEPASSSVDH